MKGKDRRELRAAGARLTPFIKIGKQGLTENIIKEITVAFEISDLLKVQLVMLKGSERKTFATELAEATQSEVVQVLGSSVLIYKA